MAGDQRSGVPGVTHARLLIAISLAAGFIVGFIVPRAQAMSGITDYQKAQLIAGCYRLARVATRPAGMSLIPTGLGPTGRDYSASLVSILGPARNCLWEVKRITGDDAIGTDLTDLRGPH